MYCQLYNLNNYPLYAELYGTVRGNKTTAAFGVQSAEKIFIGANINRFTLFVTSDYIAALEAKRQLNAYAKNAFEFLPPRQETLLFTAESGKSRIERFVALYKVLKDKIGGIVTTPEALAQLLPDLKSFSDSIFTLKQGVDYNFSALIAKLVNNGYVKAESIESAGQFTVRGDIVDIFLPHFDSPVRLDFFDETLESIKLIDKETFLSKQNIESVDVFAIKEVFNEQEALDLAREEFKRQKLDTDSLTRTNSILSSLSINGDSNWLLPYVSNSLLADYLPLDTLIIWDEPKPVEEKLSRTYEGHISRFASLLSKGEVLPSHFKQLKERENLFKGYSSFSQLALQTLPYANTFFYPQKIISLRTSALFNYKYNLKQLISDVNNWRQNEYSVGIFCADNVQATALKNQLSDLGIDIGIADTPPSFLTEPQILPYDAARGFISHSNKLVFVGCDDLFKRNIVKKLTPKKENVFLDLQAGDYAVHEVHGIGLCEGVVTRTGSFGTKDFIKLIYRDGDTVYVPVENTNMLSRYSGSDVKPHLSRIGGAEFEKVKAKVKAKIKEMAIDLVDLYAKRRHSRGFKYRIDKYLNEEFEAGFGFVETPDQIKCLEEIDADLTSDKIMDRLLVGDVGFGKTEVALRAAFKVVTNGKQAALLCPTTILSEQHFNTVKNRCQPFDIKVECLNRFRSKAEQRIIVEKLKKGEVDIIVGTHRLLGKDVGFLDLGFLILDEEQRFGVEDKEKIKLLKTNVDSLSMSATPIPRTLYMALSGMKDISVIATPPKERIAVETFVVSQSDALIRDIILREKDRGGQIFLVYNRVEGIEFFVEKIRRLVPEVSVIFAHGQMDEITLENNVFAFSQGKYDVLICTTIIENGIDMPNANTLMVFDADKLGLSQLYQLRGRVGRSNIAAYAYFVYKEDKLLTENALKRLSGIMEYSDLGSGFKIAMKDLEIRGAGNVLGREQHGHLVKVGYDMYVKLLNEAIGELEGKNKAVAFETTMEVAINAFVPAEYVPLSARMTLYQRIADINSDKEAVSLIEELVDVYGPVPDETRRLIEIALLKTMANRAGLMSVVIDDTHAKLCFVDRNRLTQKEVFDALEAYKSISKLDTSRELAILFDFYGGNVLNNINQIKNFVALLPQNTR